MTTRSRTILITGSSRGIGLELAGQLATDGHRVIATCRDPSKAVELTTLGERSNVSVIELDVTSDSSVDAAVKGAELPAIDWLINNAGQNPRDSFEGFDSAAFLASLDVNTVGALRVTHSCMPLLRAAKEAKVAFVSSQLGSLEIQRKDFGSLAYNTSKAALNMIARKLSFELAQENIVTTAIHPGWVRTDMGGPNASISPAESASGIIAILERLTAETSGQFFRHDGSSHPW